MTRLLFAAFVAAVVVWAVQAIVHDIRNPPMPFFPPVGDLRT